MRRAVLFVIVSVGIVGGLTLAASVGAARHLPNQDPEPPAETTPTPDPEDVGRDRTALRAVLGAPCTGYYDKFNLADPDGYNGGLPHEHMVGWDWATDYFCNAGNAIRVHLAENSTYRYKFKVVEIDDSTGYDSDCTAAMAGYHVKADVYAVRKTTGKHTKIGSVYYQHVSKPGSYVKEGVTYQHGQTIGLMKKFDSVPYDACPLYDVSNTDGVHTHIEADNSCFVEYSHTTPVAYGKIIGRIDTNLSGGQC